MVINLPAQAREGDPLGRAVGDWLWPEWFTADHWEMTRRITPPRQWLCLYQQTPTAEDGDYFKREWFRYYEQPDPYINTYITCDFAITVDGGDYTELAVWGVDSSRRIYALDWWHGQTDAAAWVEQILRLVRLWKPLRLVGEGDNIRKAVLPFLRRAMQDSGTYVTVEEVPSGGGNKPAKCRNFQALQENGLVYWPKTEWAERAIGQMLKFPGKHDDAVDACGVLGRYIDKIWSSSAPRPEPKALEDAWNAPLSIADFRKRIAK